jgi:hypothetical protein
VTRRIDLRIDELVVDGVAGVDPARVGPELSSELTRLIGEQGLPSRVGPADRVDAPLRGGATGAGIAAAVYEGLGRCSS